PLRDRLAGQLPGREGVPVIGNGDRKGGPGWDPGYLAAIGTGNHRPELVLPGRELLLASGAGESEHRGFLNRGIGTVGQSLAAGIPAVLSNPQPPNRRFGPGRTSRLGQY